MLTSFLREGILSLLRNWFLSFKKPSSFPVPLWGHSGTQRKDLWPNAKRTVGAEGRTVEQRVSFLGADMGGALVEERTQEKQVISSPVIEGQRG